MRAPVPLRMVKPKSQLPLSLWSDEETSGQFFFSQEMHLALPLLVVL